MNSNGSHSLPDGTGSTLAAVQDPPAVAGPRPDGEPAAVAHDPAAPSSPTLMYAGAMRSNRSADGAGHVHEVTLRSVGGPDDLPLVGFASRMGLAELAETLQSVRAELGSLAERQQAHETAVLSERADLAAALQAPIEQVLEQSQSQAAQLLGLEAALSAQQEAGARAAEDLKAIRSVLEQQQAARQDDKAPPIEEPRGADWFITLGWPATVVLGVLLGFFVSHANPVRPSAPSAPSPDPVVSAVSDDAERGQLEHWLDQTGADVPPGLPDATLRGLVFRAIELQGPGALRLATGLQTPLPMDLRLMDRNQDGTIDLTEAWPLIQAGGGEPLPAASSASVPSLPAGPPPASAAVRPAAAAAAAGAAILARPRPTATAPTASHPAPRTAPTGSAKPLPAPRPHSSAIVPHPASTAHLGRPAAPKNLPARSFVPVRPASVPATHPTAGRSTQTGSLHAAPRTPGIPPAHPKAPVHPTAKPASAIAHATGSGHAPSSGTGPTVRNVAPATGPRTTAPGSHPIAKPGQGHAAARPQPVRQAQHAAVRAAHPHRATAANHTAFHAAGHFRARRGAPLRRVPRGRRAYHRAIVRRWVPRRRIVPARTGRQ